MGLVGHDREPLAITDSAFTDDGTVGCIVVESFQEKGKIRDVVPTYVTKGKNAGKKTQPTRSRRPSATPLRSTTRNSRSPPAEYPRSVRHPCW